MLPNNLPNDHLVCQLCFRVFKTPGGLTKHLIVHHSKPPDIHAFSNNATMQFPSPIASPKELPITISHLEASEISSSDISESDSDDSEIADTSSDVENWDVIVHPDGGYIVESGSNPLICHDIFSENTKYYPWANEDELWLSNFIFSEAKMSSRVANSMLRLFTVGRLRMQQPIRFSNVHQMHKIMDSAKYSPVNLK